MNKVRNTAFLGLFSAVLLLASYWSPFIQVVNKRRTFLTADSMTAFGAVLLLALLFAVLPMDIGRLLERLSKMSVKYKNSAIAFMTIFSVGLLIYVNKAVLHSFMNSADEHSCYFLAKCLSKGLWFVEPHELSEFFNVIHVGNRDGKWFSVYPPGWPLIMMLGLKFQIVDYLNPIISSLSLIFVYLAGSKVFGKTTALTAVFLTVVTPFWAFTGASYYSHSTCLLTVSVFLWAYLNMRDESRRSQQNRWAVVVALAVGYGLITRYLTMAAIAGPFLLYHFWPVFTRKIKPQKHHWIIFFILWAFMLVVFYQNYAVTGKISRAPNKHDKSWERLGFRDFYTPLDGIVFAAARLFYLSDWSSAVFVFMFIISYVSMIRSDNAIKKLTRSIFILPAFAYFFYFSWGGNQYGPRYYWEGFPFMMLSVMDYIRGHWVKDDRKVKNFFSMLIIGSLVINGYLFMKQSEYFEAVSAQRKALYSYSEENAQKPAIVFISGGFIGQRLVMSTEDAVRNSPFLDGGLLYAKDLGEGKNKELLTHFEGYRGYKGSYDREALKARLEEF